MRTQTSGSENLTALMKSKGLKKKRKMKKKQKKEQEQNSQKKKKIPGAKKKTHL